MDMAHALHDARRSLRSSPVFAFYLLATLVAAGIIGLITLGVIDLGMTHFGDPDHRTHDVTYGLLFATLVVGMLAQLRRPGKNVAGMVMALIPAGALGLAAILSGDVDRVWQFNPFRNAAAVAVVAALVHPAGRGFLRSFSLSRVNPVMVTLLGAAAVPWLALASTNIRLQRNVLDQHGGMGHYGFMAAFCFTVVGVGLLASMRPDGWRLTAWVGGSLPALLGVTSLVSPDAASSLAPLGSLAAIAWGVAFVAVADAGEGQTRPRSTSLRAMMSRRTTSSSASASRATAAAEARCCTRDHTAGSTP